MNFFCQTTRDPRGCFEFKFEKGKWGEKNSRFFVFTQQQKKNLIINEKTNFFFHILMWAVLIVPMFFSLTDFVEKNWFPHNNKKKWWEIVEKTLREN